MPKISILIPTYNIERYVGRCLESVFGQTFGDFEAVAVLDGSTDGSEDILRDYASRDPRLKIVSHDGNQGLLWGRKTCIEAAQGDYLMFVDGDDELEPDACERLYGAAVATGADMVAAGHHACFSDGRKVPRTYRLDHGHSSAGVVKAMLLRELNHFLWGKIYRRSLMQGHPYKYYRHFNMWEDKVLSFQLARFMQKAVCIDDQLYRYHQNQFSLSRRRLTDRDLVTIMMSNAVVMDVASDMGDEIVGLAESNVIEHVRLLLQDGYNAKVLKRLASEQGLSHLFTFRSLARHLGGGDAVLFLSEGLKYNLSAFKKRFVKTPVKHLFKPGEWQRG